MKQHPDSFWPPRVGARFYPDFVAKLTDGRLFDVENKGEPLVGAPEAREKAMIGAIWAGTTGRVLLIVRKVEHGVDVSGRLRRRLVRDAVKACSGRSVWL